jgi:hypothetical protein
MLEPRIVQLIGLIGLTFALVIWIREIDKRWRLSGLLPPRSLLKDTILTAQARPTRILS